MAGFGNDPGVMAAGGEDEGYVGIRQHFDFEDRLDVVRFCELAQEHGLYVILRIGPYICAETNYGGFPSWLRDVPGMQMRTNNEPFKREMKKWVEFFCEKMRHLFAPNGGPIILAQLENEYALIAKNYGAEGEKYLEWVVDLERELDLGVPLIMCFGSAPGAIETINAHYGHEKLEQHFENHPDHYMTNKIGKKAIESLEDKPLIARYVVWFIPFMQHKINPFEKLILVDIKDQNSWMLDGIRREEGISDVYVCTRHGLSGCCKIRG